MSATVQVLADIGGTNVRITHRSEGARPRPVVFATRDYAGFEAVLAAYLARRRITAKPAGIAVCAAGPVTARGIRLTNKNWSIDRESLERHCGGNVVIVNDLTALAAAVKFVPRRQLRSLDRCRPVAGAAIGVVAVGTGLGVSGIVPAGADATGLLSGEGGHVSLAPFDEESLAVFEHLRARFGRVSAECVLSGPGLEHLYDALARNPASARAVVRAAEIAARAEAGEQAALDAIRLFTDWLGQFCGDLALTLGARGGIFLGGGILPAWKALFDPKRFRRRFDAKGPLGGYVESIPVRLITDDFAALRGLQSLASTTRSTAASTS